MAIVVTLANSARASRVESQHSYLDGTAHGLVALDASVPELGGVTRIATLDGLHLAQARNKAGDWAAAQADNTDGVIIFLDADCVPAPDLVDSYVLALTQFPHSVVTGPVTYLKENQTALIDNPHPARPLPAPGETLTGHYDVFWSLNFALTAQTWQHIRTTFGGFDERLTGYGGEDTDFSWMMRKHGIELRWLAGAHAYHRWHPVSSPPWEHLEDIVKNANYLHTKWGTWPMHGWLDEFARDGAITMGPSGWELS